MGESKLAFLLGVALSALVAMWLRMRALVAENELLTAALGGLAASMALDADEEEPMQEWGD